MDSALNWRLADQMDRAFTTRLLPNSHSCETKVLHRKASCKLAFHLVVSAFAISPALLPLWRKRFNLRRSIMLQHPSQTHLAGCDATQPDFFQD
jgi:hypothetical protein